MKQLRILSVLALPVSVVLLAAACGGGESVPKSSIAVVGDHEIARADYDALWEQTKASYKAQDRELPKTGTAEWTTLKANIVQFLVQRAQFEQKAEELGIEVTDKQIDQRLEEIKKQYFEGSDEKLQEQLEKQNITMEGVRRDIRAQIIQEELHKKVTGDVKVTDKEVRAYYDENQEQYGTPESRDVRHILVDAKDKKLADQLLADLKNGANFAALAKKHSKDPGSAAQGGKLTISKGQTVPEFEKLSFSLKKDELGGPVKTTYGWHIIQALSDVKKAKVTPFEEVKEQIEQQLLETKKSEKMAKWVEDLKKELADETRYQVGFAPPAETAATTATQ